MLQWSYEVMNKSWRNEVFILRIIYSRYLNRSNVRQLKCNIWNRVLLSDCAPLKWRTKCPGPSHYWLLLHGKYRKDNNFTGVSFKENCHFGIIMKACRTPGRVIYQRLVSYYWPTVFHVHSVKKKQEISKKVFIFLLACLF